MGEEVLSSDAGTIFRAALIPIAWHVGCDRLLEQTPLGYSQPWMRAYPTVALPYYFYFWNSAQTPVLQSGCFLFLLLF